MVKVNIRYNQYLGGIEFPCDEGHLKRVLESMHVPEEEILKPEMFMTDVSDYEELEVLKDKFVNLDELNYLTKRLASFDKMELHTFNAAIENGRYNNLKDFINLTFNPDKYILIKDFSNPETVGKRYYMAKNLGATEKELLETDFEKIGRKVIESPNHRLTTYGLLIENNDVEFKEVYNGETFPAYGNNSYLFRADITYEGKTEYVYMPDDEIAIDKAVKRLGAESLSNRMIDVEYGYLSDYEWFDKIKGITYTEGLKAANKVLNCLDKFDLYEFEKLKALIEFADRSDAESVIKLAKNIDEFYLYENVTDMEELGKAMIDENEDYSIHEDIEDYFMYEKYAESVLKYTDMGFTRYGAVVSKGEMLAEVLGEKIDRAEIQEEDVGMTMM